MAAEGMQSHDQSCGNCPTASHPATKKGRINAPILPKPARRAKSDRLLGHDPEKWNGFRKRSRSNNKEARDANSKKSHPALRSLRLLLRHRRRRRLLEALAGGQPVVIAA